VTNSGRNDTVSVIDPATNTVVGTIIVGSQPVSIHFILNNGIAFDPDNGFMYVANQNSGTVSVIDPPTNTVIDTIPVGATSIAIAFDLDTGSCM
jgi:YVTN family beta-propeller protein